jgi:hypothetical protein
MSERPAEAPAPAGASADVTAGGTEGLVRVGLAVPAYAHPIVDPDLWDRLARAAGHLRFVVVNVHDGPGASLDPAYPPVLERLRAARVRMVGYVDTAYGKRPARDVIADARTWVTRYGVHGVFLDQVAGDFEHLGFHSAVALGARAAGAQFIVLNPGTSCHPGYADIANVTVTFEGCWADYGAHRPRPWMLALPATRFCHLVHHVPPDRLGEGPSRAAARHAGTAMFSSGSGANPWDQLPDELLHAVRRPHPGAVVATAVGNPSWQGRRYTGQGARPEVEDLTRDRSAPARHARHAPHPALLLPLRSCRGSPDNEPRTPPAGTGPTRPPGAGPGTEAHQPTTRPPGTPAAPQQFPFPTPIQFPLPTPHPVPVPQPPIPSSR